MLSASTVSFFSVIVATYNRAKLIRRALDSLLMQTEKDWELVLVDDGSEDSTADILKNYIDKFPQMHFHRHQKNRGVVAAKNTGIAMARGRYITFLDSDDAYKADHLLLRKKILQKDPSIDLLHGGFEIIGDEYVPDINKTGEQIHLSQCAVSGTFFIKKSKLTRLKGFAGKTLGTDADFMKRAQAQHLHIEKTNLPTYIYYRNQRDSITKNHK